MTARAIVTAAATIAAVTAACTAAGDGPGPNAGPITPPAPSCELGVDGRAEVAAPRLIASFSDRWHEGWLASPAVADLDGDGGPEIVLARAGLLVVWRADGAEAWRRELPGRIWAPPVVADLVPGRAGLEVAVAARGTIYAFGADGSPVPGYPFDWRDELRSLAAGDIDGDGRLELVAVTTSPLAGNGQRDIVIAIDAESGARAAAFPANTTGRSGCDEACYVTGGYDQNIALGDVDGDGIADVFATQDNAYLSLHRGDGTAFEAAPIFDGRRYFMGVRFLHDYALAQQGWANDESAANQAHFTNSAPAIADVDGGGDAELVVLGSVQNAAQTDRERGVALWVVNEDGTRPSAWEAPFHAPGYLSGLWDFDGTNVVGATNQVAVADIDPSRPGPEMVFAGFDGRIHAVDAAATAMWSYRYTDDARVLTAGVAIADLSADGRPEIVFASYSPDDGKARLFVIDAGGNELHVVSLPDRGAMAVPTLADADGDGAVDIVLAMKAGADGQPQAMVFAVDTAQANCLVWPTGRGNLHRNGWVVRADGGR